MVLIDNPHHMGLIRTKTKEVKWCTQRGLTWPLLQSLIESKKWQKTWYFSVKIEKNELLLITF